MMEFNSCYRRIKSIVMAGMLVLPLAACAEDKREDSASPRTDLMPFSIAFDLKGEPVLLDGKGDRIPPSDIQFPLAVTAIESVESITLVQYKGSHVKLVKIGGKMYAVPLPH